MQVSTIPMLDGSDATYVKGSLQVFCGGIVYFNSGPYMFSENSVGKKTKDSLQINSPKGTVILPQAKTFTLPVKKATEDLTFVQAGFATYVEGGFELRYEDEVYLKLSDHPLDFPLPPLAFAFLADRGTKLRILNLRERFRDDLEFEKKSDSALEIRKQLDMKSYVSYTTNERRAAALKKHAAKAMELGKRALDAARELIQFEESVKEEAKTDYQMFEDDDFPLSAAEAAFECVVNIAERHYIAEEVCVKRVKTEK